VHAYQLRPNATEQVEQIWNQGKVISDSVVDSPNGTLWEGEVTVLGALAETDQVKLFGESYKTELPTSMGGRWFGEAKIISNTGVALQPIDWPASMDLEYQVNSSSLVVTVTAHVTLPVMAGPPFLQTDAGIQI
jgi:hypothetical protein